MAAQETHQKPLKAADFAEFIPQHWKTVRVWQDRQGDTVKGVAKIVCRTDKKTFAADFEAKMGSDGEIAQLYLNGKKASRKFCP